MRHLAIRIESKNRSPCPVYLSFLKDGRGGGNRCRVSGRRKIEVFVTEPETRASISIEPSLSARQSADGYEKGGPPTDVVEDHLYSVSLILKTQRDTPHDVA